MFFWGMAIFIAVSAVVLLLVVLLKLSKPQTIVIGNDFVTVPKASLSGKIITHQFYQISKIGVTVFGGQEFYLIDSPAGVTRLLPKAFANVLEYDLFKQNMADRVGGLSKELGTFV